MTHQSYIVILTAFAKKNEVKIRFENRKEMTTVMPLLSFTRSKWLLPIAKKLLHYLFYH